MQDIRFVSTGGVLERNAPLIDFFAIRYIITAKPFSEQNPFTSSYF